MSKPIGQHYLPKAAYLKFFENPKKPGFIYFYQRAKDPILPNTINVAKERHLYSFIDESGNYNFEIENLLQCTEDEARPILEKLNNCNKASQISIEEKANLSIFIACQAVRIPAFRKALQELNSKFLEITALAMAQNKKVLEASIEKTRQRYSSEFPGETTIEEMQKAILSGDFTYTVSGDQYFLKQTLQLASALVSVILIKQITVLKIEEAKFITSDYPVSIVADQNLGPAYGVGFLTGHIVLPIGSHSVLYLSNEDEHLLSIDPDHVDISYKKLSPFEARQINKHTMLYAERYLFAAENNTKIKELFDKTTAPKRWQVSSPLFNSGKS